MFSCYFPASDGDVSLTLYLFCMCRVTIFVVATEDAGKGCQITQTKGPVPQVIAFEKRVGRSPFHPVWLCRGSFQGCQCHSELRWRVPTRQTCDISLGFVQLAAQFPKPDGPEAIIDVSQFEERQLTAAHGDTYPLIIRLECVSDKGRTESHQLQVFPCSSWLISVCHC